MLKTLTLALVLGASTLGVASAQQTPATPTPAPGTTLPAPTAAAPIPGANSFTEAQIKTRLENNGFAGVTGLIKDQDGIWRGMATKGGSSVSVSVDYQGNIVQK
jgi:hypothetical protein